MPIIAHLSPPMTKEVTEELGSKSLGTSPSDIALNVGDGIKFASLVWSDVDNRKPPFDTADVVRIFEGRAFEIEFATIIECTDGMFTLLSRPSFGRHQSLEAAQEIAQSDFESRLRSVVHSVPNSLQIDQVEKDLIVTGLNYAVQANRTGARELLAKFEAFSN